MNETQQHILVVDDEEHLAVGIKFNLEAEGYRATAVGNGVDAIAAVEDESNPVDLVVLDLMLPRMSGYEVCEKIRQSGFQMPVLMLSARTLSEDRVRGFNVGANQYLVKPFELEELLSRIKSLLLQAGSQPKTTIDDSLEKFEFGDAKLNFKTYEMSFGEKPVRLTELQIRVLKYFVEHEGVVIPRSKLLEDVWGMPGHMNTRAPDQILRQLRKAFEKNPSKPVHFLTIRDAGYRFVSATDS